MPHILDTVQALESQVGKPPAAVGLKVIDHLDAHALRWLAASPLLMVSVCQGEEMRATLAGGARGFAQSDSPTQLRLPAAALDDPQHLQAGCGIGLLALIPGLGETLRINGVVQAATPQSIVVTVSECYAHCAKALIRSDFWQGGEATRLSTVEQFLQAASFMGLATADAQGNTDMSPKGDPAGLLLQQREQGLCFADRPGNRRTDSFHNIVDCPRAALIALVPGCEQVLLASGPAELSADEALRASFAVQDKTPHLVTRLKTASLVLQDSRALALARLWEDVTPPDIVPAEVFAAHVKLNKTRGLAAAMMRGMVSVPGLLQKGLEQDYKKNLY